MDDKKDTRSDADKAKDAAAGTAQAKDPALAAAETRRQAELDRGDPGLAARRDTAVADRDAELRRGDTRTTTNPRAPEAVARQHFEVDQAAEKRNEDNRPGHERNMERIEAEAHEAQMRTENANHHLANHVPTGKQENRNTPRVLADGTKVWDK